ncbi:MAG: aspartate dehydrogenase [Clostridiales bacterium]|nr:aspartate dehydrogenase [Clostridiales bacterium]
MMFGKKKKELSYDRDAEEPVIRRSICTGEITYGIKDRKSQRFRDIGRASSLEEAYGFFEERGIKREEVRIIY